MLSLVLSSVRVFDVSVSGVGSRNVLEAGARWTVFFFQKLLVTTTRKTKALSPEAVSTLERNRYIFVILLVGQKKKKKIGRLRVGKFVGKEKKNQNNGQYQKSTVIHTTVENQSRTPRCRLVASETQGRIPISNPSECSINQIAR